MVRFFPLLYGCRITGERTWQPLFKLSQKEIKRGDAFGKPRTTYSQENTALLPDKLIHQFNQVHYFCALFEKWQKILKTDAGSQMLFEKPNKGHVH